MKRLTPAVSVRSDPWEVKLALLQINDLGLEFVAKRGATQVLHGIDLSVDRGQIMGMVGETGAGKSVAAMSVARLLPSPPARYTSGRVLFEGRDVLDFAESELRRWRGVRIGMVFQDPSSNFNPVFTVRQQLMDVALHVANTAPERLGLTPHAGRRARRRAALDACLSLLDKVGIPDARARFDSYPHQFSGGMRQRALIAMALLGRPELLIADEPTTALDVTVQARVLELLYDLVEEFNLAMLLITHNMGVVAKLCTDVAVMSDGRIVEKGDVRSVLRDPQHPYTRKLLNAIPRVRPAAGEQAPAAQAP